jgi:hypothetical protein
LAGIALILGTGLFVLLRERQKTRARATPFCDTFSLLEAFT